MAHEPIQFGRASGDPAGEPPEPPETAVPPAPRSLDLQKDRALTVTWADGRISIYPIAYLRKMSPSAEARALREEMQRNPLAVLPSTGGGDLTATGAELVGRYALRIHFSDGHDTGIYSWAYLREIDPNRPAPPESKAPPADPDAQVRP